MRNPRNEPLGKGRTGRRTGAAEVPERRCILTGRTACCDDLVRLALSPQGEILPDALARAPGRGAWIGVTRAELAEALESGRLKSALARAFKQSGLTISSDLPEMVDNAMRRALAERLGLEFRAGRLILGADRIAGEARMGKVAALYHAADASDDGARKLDQAWRVGADAEGSGMAGERLPLDRTALSVALGRENVVHLALADRASADRISVPLRRLQTFLGAGKATNCGNVETQDALREAAATD